LHAVRSESTLARTPVIFITADNTPRVRQKAIQAGADAYLTKPFTTEDLAEIISHLLLQSNHQRLS